MTKLLFISATVIGVMVFFSALTTGQVKVAIAIPVDKNAGRLTEVMILLAAQRASC